jgi:hypothetical protein
VEFRLFLDPRSDTPLVFAEELASWTSECAATCSPVSLFRYLREDTSQLAAVLRELTSSTWAPYFRIFHSEFEGQVHDVASLAQLCEGDGWIMDLVLLAPKDDPLTNMIVFEIRLEVCSIVFRLPSSAERHISDIFPKHTYSRDA